MGQRLIEIDCPVCGSRNRLACYGVVAHAREGATVRYYLCRKCGARVSRKYYDVKNDSDKTTWLHRPASPCDFRLVAACKPRAVGSTSETSVKKQLALAL